MEQPRVAQPVGNAERSARLGLGAGSGSGTSGDLEQAKPAVEPSTAPGVDATTMGGAANADQAPMDAGRLDASPEAAKGPAITVENFVQSPSGAKDRTTVGLGEITYFSADVEGVKYAASGGKGSMEKDGSYKWEAPSTAGEHTITATGAAGSTTIKMKVVAPDKVKGTKTGEYSKGYKAGSHGAGLYLDLVLQPIDVNFQNLQWKEVQGPIAATGVMKGREPGIHHNPSWSGVGMNNQIKDTAEHHDFPKPWDAGTVTYDVEQHYRVGAKGTDTKFDTAKQEHEMFGTNGEAQERKAGADSDKRTP